MVKGLEEEAAVLCPPVPIPNPTPWSNQFQIILLFLPLTRLLFPFWTSAGGFSSPSGEVSSDCTLPSQPSQMWGHQQKRFTLLHSMTFPDGPTSVLGAFLSFGFSPKVSEHRMGHRWVLPRSPFLFLFAGAAWFCSDVHPVATWLSNSWWCQASHQGPVPWRCEGWPQGCFWEGLFVLRETSKEETAFPITWRRECQGPAGHSRSAQLSQLSRTTSYLFLLGLPSMPTVLLLSEPVHLWAWAPPFFSWDFLSVPCPGSPVFFIYVFILQKHILQRFGKQVCLKMNLFSRLIW